MKGEFCANLRFSFIKMDQLNGSCNSDMSFCQGQNIGQTVSQVINYKTFDKLRTSLVLDKIWHHIL